MALVYINDFNDPTYQFKIIYPAHFPGPVTVERLLTGFEPAYSQFIFVNTGVKVPLHGKIERFGSMLSGATSPNAPLVKIVVEEMRARLCIGNMLGPLTNAFSGAAVTVEAGGASAAQDQSQGFFLIPEFKITAIDASLTFDTPIAPTADKWSVAIILKSGDQTDQSTDQRLGIDTQFKGGDAYIAVLTPPAAVVTPPVVTTQADSGKTFANYDNGCTQFTLHYTIKQNPRGTLTATGSLQVGTAAPVSPAPSFDIDLPNLNFVTAIGASITTTSPIPQIAATFRQFTINSVTLAP